MSFAVLFVCTGNICRSPMAERLLIARLPLATDVVATSAGTRAMVGYGMDRPAAHVLRQLGGNPEGHVARQLDPQQVAGADLVLTAATAHRDRIIRATPAAMRRTFTLREFVRLGASAELAGSPAERVTAAAAQRGLVEPAAPGSDDIGDPYGAPLPVMERCGQEISAVVDGIVRILVG